MKRLLAVAALAAGALLCVAHAAPARRIVSLAPGLTELAYDAGAGNYVVGTSAYTDYPAAAGRLPQVGDAFHIDVERVVALKPDLVLAWASAAPPDLIARLRQLHLRVVVFDLQSFAGIVKALRTIGRLTATADHAEAVAARFEAGLAALKKQYARRAPVRVFYEISANPLYTVNGEQIISKAIELCGGHNIFAELPTLAASVTVGAVIARDPQAIVTGGTGTEAKQRLGAWTRWPQLTAVAQHALFAIPPNEIARATPRMLGGIEKLCKALDAARR